MQKVNATQLQSQVLQPVVPELTLNRVAQKVWRRSHSYNSVKNLKSSVRAFNRFMEVNDLTWEKCLENPITSLDDFVGFLDMERKKLRSTRLFVGGLIW